MFNSVLHPVAEEIRLQKKGLVQSTGPEVEYAFPVFVQGDAAAGGFFARLRSNSAGLPNMGGTGLLNTRDPTNRRSRLPVQFPSPSLDILPEGCVEPEACTNACFPLVSFENSPERVFSRGTPTSVARAVLWEPRNVAG